MKKILNGYAKQAIIIARVSTEEQASQDHFSIPAQLRILREYVKRGGKFGTIKKIIEEFQIEESASKKTRKRFEQAIKVAEKSQETVAIITERVDRFQRSFRESVQFDDLRREGKVELHFVSDNLVIHKNSSPSDLLIWDALVMFARAYVTGLSNNVMRTFREKLARGLFPGYVPAGYGNVLGKIEVDKEKAGFVKKAFRLYATGQYSLEGLSKILAKEGFTSKTKKIWSGDSLIDREAKPVNGNDLYAILKNPFPTGKFLWRDPDTQERKLWDSKGSYPTLITEELYQTVQGILDKHDSRADGYQNNDFKFRGLLTCGYCKCRMTAEEMSRTYRDQNNPNAKTVYHHCTSGKAIANPDFYKSWGSKHSGVYIGKKGKNKGEKVFHCPQRWWKEPDIEELVLKQLEICHYDEEVFSKLRQILEQEYQERVLTAEEQLKGLRAELSKTEPLKKALIRSMAIEADSELRQEFKHEYETVKKNQNEIEEEIRMLEESKDLDADETVNVLRLASNLKEQYLEMNSEEQVQFLKTVFSEIIVMRGWTLNPKTGEKLEATNYSEFEWNEPLRKYFQIGLNKIIAEWEKTQTKVIFLTEKNKTEASPFP